MTAKDKYVIVVSAVLAAIIFSGAGWLLGRQYGIRHATDGVKVTHDTTIVTRIVHDTVRVKEYRERVRVDTVTLAVVKDSLTTTQDTTISETIVPADADSVKAEVPISQVTCEGENYKAVIEGFRPRLVSIDITQQTQYIETVKTIPPKKWGFGIQLGLGGGYFITPAGWQPGAGVVASIGFDYRFW